VSFGRKKYVHVLAALAIALTGLCATTTSANADPEQDLQEAKAKVEKLHHLAEVASERYNDARVKAVDLKTRLDALNADLERQQKVVDGMRRDVATSVVDQFQGSSLSASTQMVLSDDPDAFLDNLNAVSTFNTQKGQILGDYQEELERLELRRKAVREESAKLDALQREMLAEKQKVDDRSAEAEEVVSGLEAEAAAQLAAVSTTDTASAGTSAAQAPVSDVPASGRAKVAVDYALAQVGKPYVYGAAGPDSFDCSGLTMAAWGAAGVSLPHSSSGQQGVTRPISASELVPGDLVFYYSPTSHVGIYIGNGQVVSALNPSQGIQVHSLYMMPFNGAGRVG
jgi:cell wall-associated NlpC family hydrolase